jgi:hypothetical protein
MVRFPGHVEGTVRDGEEGDPLGNDHCKAGGHVEPPIAVYSSPGGQGDCRSRQVAFLELHVELKELRIFDVDAQASADGNAFRTSSASRAVLCLIVREIAGGSANVFKIEEADGTMVFQVKDTGNVGIRDISTNVDLKVQNKSGNDFIFLVEEADGSNVFEVGDDGNIGIRETSSDSAFNIRNGGGNDVILNCEKSDDTVRFQVKNDGKVWAPGLRSVGIAPNDLGITNNGELVQAASSRRYKENIEPFADNFDLNLQTELKQ